MGKHLLFVGVLGAAVLFVPSPTDACIHAAGSGGEPVPISQKGHQGLLVWHDGKQELVLKIEYESGADVSAIGMVVPVPSVPDAYDTADPNLFTALDRWVHLERQQPASRGAMSLRSRNGHGPSQDSLVALPPAAAGPYRIQPLQAFGDEGVTALTTWMEENHFAPIPREVLSYYTERNWTFLTVKVDPAEGGALGREGGLPPLRARFATERAIYPLMLEAQGTFPLRLYLVTREPLPDAALQGAVARGFEVAGAGSMRALGARRAPLAARIGRFTAERAPSELRAILSDFEGLGVGELTVRVLFARNFGRGAADPSSWREELSFPGVDDGDRLMGTAEQETETGTETETETETETGAETGAETETEAAAATESETEAAAATESEDEDEDSGMCTAAGRPQAEPVAALLLGALWLTRRRRG